MIDPESIPRLMAAGTIEVAPLAYMRGRTLNDAFIILDEAQNTSPEQMKMFLTRLGFGSKMVVTGDVTQVDLPGGTRSGLRVVQEILDGVDDVALLPADQRTTSSGTGWSADIVDAYGRWDDTAAGRAIARRSRARLEPPSASGAVDEHRGQQRVRRRRSTETRSPRSPGSCSTGCASTRWPSCRCCWSTPTR